LKPKIPVKLEDFIDWRKEKVGGWIRA